VLSAGLPFLPGAIHELEGESMQRHLLALTASVLCLAALTGTAGATDTPTPSPTAVQSAAQLAGSVQAAAAEAISAQYHPENTSISTRTMSPGDDGSVDQSNNSGAAALAANGNDTDQDVEQNADGLSDGTAVQDAAQAALNGQLAKAAAESIQIAPENEAISTDTKSPGDGGSVEQENNSGALALAGNKNDTDQTAAQSQGGDGSGTGVQSAAQKAANAQAAAAEAASIQIAPENTTVASGIKGHEAGKGHENGKAHEYDKSDRGKGHGDDKSYGSDGSVDQHNNSGAAALAGNKNDTDQTAAQSQGGAGSGTGVQAAGQKAANVQAADASALSKQIAPENTNISTRIFSPGDGGSVSQSNNSAAGAIAANGNDTDQGVAQSQGGGSGTGVQASGQEALSKQAARAEAASIQVKPVNKYISVRIFSPGNDGAVSQSNNSWAGALAANKNETDQSAGQSGGGGSGTGVQSAGQTAANLQSAAASAVSKQIEPKNVFISVRIFSPGDNGAVSQSNNSWAGAAALNGNALWQGIRQGGGHSSRPPNDHSEPKAPVKCQRACQHPCEQECYEPRKHGSCDDPCLGKGHQVCRKATCYPGSERPMLM